jgi:hypothetical protein
MEGQRKEEQTMEGTEQKTVNTVPTSTGTGSKKIMRLQFHTISNTRIRRKTDYN